jgi:hypothetical protein
VWRLFNNAQLRQQMSGTVAWRKTSEISQVRVADLIEHLTTRHFCFVTLVFGRS